jgi:hypothetical protein
MIEALNSRPEGITEYGIERFFVPSRYNLSFHGIRKDT